MRTTSSGPVTLLAIESSCDETSCAISRDEVILSNIIAGQAVHEQYGGVVPELASRAHMQNIVPVVDAALKKAGVSISELTAIAFTQSPGLIGSLLVGSQFAKSLAQALDIPLLSVHHMQAHVLANLIVPASAARSAASSPVASTSTAASPGPASPASREAARPSFPFLCLTVSGGHTQIVLCHSPLKMEVIGETLDDAAGEAFDKSAKLLGLPYPGGPLIDKYAREGDAGRFPFPEPQIPGLNFSFSGLKTAILYFLQENVAKDAGFVAANLPDICASIQGRIISILLNKYRKAARETGVTDLCIAGGVSANSGLRKAFGEMGRNNGWNTFIPPFEYCTDNAAMIAITGYYKYLAGEFAPLSVSASARAEW
ncbi:tRNA (adenosine(37)-N6)-threonylcarbamoyltransferase complex transferase subunit TsaD [Puia dinghuensis]|uniref:tRNA N6-adenosine threonylcarbamoyltransferase n=1 Tax=Puia dinghuensis TaxID=1792502 RepID=A0A8J2U8K1_9BACT|nr:tRNA (adenosine(37)-N6)-threonylcarbamoyltransferase complex transferase subunit TsaD [Puia dinghuensis]GGA86425.1 tRNA N6-adenosine threonylcarbamoyltransferase [Puia dinghuensis]